MSANSRDYWKDREEENLKKCIKEEAKYIKELNNTYDYMLRQIQKEIDSFYTRYANKEGITITEARKRVKKLDIDEYAEKAKRYVKEKNFSDLANAEMRLYNLTMKVNRLELLKAQIGLELAAGFNEIEKQQEQILNQRAQDELARQAGILGKTLADNAKMANAIVNASFKNAKFSDRIWMHQEMLKSELDRLLKIGLIQGRNPRELARQLRKSFDTSRYNSERLMRTELARVQTEAQKQSYIRNGYDRYQFHALGLKACEICRDIDSKDFPVDKMMPGENAPPMHPNCRCSTSAYMDRAEYEKWLDGYKDHGLSFGDWKKKNSQIPTFIDKNKMSKSQLKKATEIEQMAKDTNAIVGKHTNKESEWSGKISFSDGSDGYIAAKLPGCDIGAILQIKKHNLIHEHLHARSVSRENGQVYIKHRAWEEIPVEFFAREICIKENVEIDYSKYYNSVENLKKINDIIKIGDNNYNFAKMLFETKPQNRKNWVRTQIAERANDFVELDKLEKLLEGVEFLGQDS